MTATELLYFSKVKTNQIAFCNKIINIASLLGINPNWLMFVINFESSGTFSASVPNGVGSGGVGLIQFMPETAAGLLGYSKSKYSASEWHTICTNSINHFAAMSNVEQLDYVYKYFKPYAGKYKIISDLYLFTFYPYAMGKPDTYVLGSQISTGKIAAIASQNSSLDLNKDHQITLGEWKQALYNILIARLSKQTVDEWFTVKKKDIAILGIAAFSFLVGVIIYKIKH